jgi:hypothetical protein
MIKGIFLSVDKVGRVVLLTVLFVPRVRTPDIVASPAVVPEPVFPMPKTWK